MSISPTDQWRCWRLTPHRNATYWPVRSSLAGDKVKIKQVYFADSTGRIGRGDTRTTSQPTARLLDTPTEHAHLPCASRKVFSQGRFCLQSTNLVWVYLVIYRRYLMCGPVCTLHQYGLTNKQPHIHTPPTYRQVGLIWVMCLWYYTTSRHSIYQIIHLVGIY